MSGLVSCFWNAAQVALDGQHGSEGKHLHFFVVVEVNEEVGEAWTAKARERKERKSIVRRIAELKRYSLFVVL